MRRFFTRLKGWWSEASTRRKALFTISALVVAVAAPLAVQADSIAGSIGNFIGLAVAWFFDLLVQLMGWILLQEVSALLSVAQYTNFVSPGPTAVRYGWVVVRDLSNMFFILILLIIAFATILSYEEYNYRKLLPRLFIMAVVINFSKTITGLFIDFGQVVMLTFVNGFVTSAGGNFARAFQVDKMLEMRTDGSSDTWAIALAMVLAFIMLTIACAVVLVMLVMLLFRIVYLWVLIILSPIAFLASTFPPAKKYYAQWWDELRKYIITGPMIAFFLWLALISVQKAAEKPDGNIGRDAGFVAATAGESQAASLRGGQKLASGPASAVTRKDVFISFIVAIAMLMAGLKVAIESGTAGAGFAGAVKGRLRSAGRDALRLGRNLGRIGYKGGKIGGGLGLKALGAGLTGALRFGRGTGRAAKRVGGWAAGTGIGQKIAANSAVQKVARGARTLKDVMNVDQRLRQSAVEMRTRAAGLRASGDEAGARKLERTAKYAGWAAKASRGALNVAGIAGAGLLTGGVGGVVAGGAGIASIFAAPSVREAAARRLSAGDKAKAAVRDERVDEAGKALNLNEAKDIVSGATVAKNKYEQAAAFKKVLEQDKLTDPSQAKFVADTGRALLGKLGASPDAVKAFEEKAREKAFAYYDKDGKADVKKEDEAIAKGEVKAGELSDAAMKRLLDKTTAMDASYFAAGGPGAGMPGLEREVKSVREAIIESARGRKATNEHFGTRLAAYDTRASGGTAMTPAEKKQRSLMAEMFVASGGSAGDQRAYGVDPQGIIIDAGKRADFKEVVKGKNAAKVVMSLDLGVLGDTAGSTAPPGTDPNFAMKTIMDSIGKTDLQKVARDALQSGNAEMRDKITQLVQYIEKRAKAAEAASAAGTPSPVSRSTNEEMLARIIEKNNSFDAFRS